MTKLDRFGLGCMGMSNRRNPESSIKTVHTALDAGIAVYAILSGNSTAFQREWGLHMI